MPTPDETAVDNSCRECGEVDDQDVCEDCRVCSYCCHRNQQRHETAVAARVLRERLSTLTRNERCVIARYAAAFSRADASESDVTAAAVQIARVIFPEVEEATDG